MLKFRLLVSFMVNENSISRHRRHRAQSDVTPKKASGVTEEMEIDDLLMQKENANLQLNFLLCFLNLLQEAQKSLLDKD